MQQLISGILVATLVLATTPAWAQEAATVAAPHAGALAPGLFGFSLEHNQATRLRISVHVSNPARMSEQVLRLAEDETTRIYRTIGVNIEWVHGSARTFQFVIVIVPAGMAEHYTHARGVLGLTPSTPWHRGGLAYVFYDRVEGTALSSGVSIARLLGHAIAHEMGHMLLPSGHSVNGLMRAAWDAVDFRLASQGCLHFTNQQGELILARLLDSRE
jgi:hypothetical protein